MAKLNGMHMKILLTMIIIALWVIPSFSQPTFFDGTYGTKLSKKGF